MQASCPPDSRTSLNIKCFMLPFALCSCGAVVIICRRFIYYPPATHRIVHCTRKDASNKPSAHPPPRGSPGKPPPQKQTRGQVSFRCTKGKTPSVHLHDTYPRKTMDKYYSTLFRNTYPHKIRAQD